MMVGIEYAISRLKEKGIISINHQKINVAGEIDIVAFDKTGTLTENKLNVKGIVINSSRNKEYKIEESIRQY